MIRLVCEDPSKQLKAIPVDIDNDHARVIGAERTLTFNRTTVEWRDAIGYTYSLNGETNTLHRVHAATNTGYVFECRKRRAGDEPPAKR